MRKVSLELKILTAFFLSFSAAPAAVARLPQAQLFAVSSDTALFTDIAAALPGVQYGSAAWGDYDNDGDLDILLCGLAGQGVRLTKLYRNDAGTFVDTESLFIGVDLGTVAWGDYDNDNDLDFVLAGNTPAGIGIAKIYRNDAGAFVDINAPLVGVYGSAAWGDYDNDGDLDLVIIGFGSGAVSRIYRNDQGHFIALPASFADLYAGEAAWGDYDNDGDLDLLVNGITALSVIVTQIYQNNSGAFIDTQAPLQGVVGNALAWGDYDNDGDLDLALSGIRDSDGSPPGPPRTSQIYRNEAGIFTSTKDTLLAVSSGDAAWGDYDNDGDLDLLLTGWTRDSTFVTKIYTNQNGVFIALPDEQTTLIGAFESAAAWGDYDHDGDLDILLTGVDKKIGLFAKVYRNNLIKKNMPPAPPANLLAYASHDTVIFAWDKSTDGETPPSGLSYNLRLGTTAGGNEIVAPMADLTTGFRWLPQRGNVQHNNFGVITGLPDGKYYWSVQAIDHAFAGSAFAPEDSFFIGAVDIEAPRLSNLLAPAVVDSGTTATVSATVTDNVAVAEVWLLYREGGRVFYDSTAMLLNANQTAYQAAIPRSAARTRGVEFNVVAGDASSNRKVLGWRSVQVRLRDRDLRRTHLGGSAQEAYRLISIPLASDDPAVNSLLLPDLGAPDTTEWRMWAINPSRANSLFPYIEYPAVGNLAPGKAKFLITLENKTLTSGAGVTVITTAPFSIPLQEGWNTIASPFNFAIPLQNVQPQELRANLYAYNGSWQAAPDSLRPWVGYMIKVSTPMTLIIQPSESIVIPQSAIAKSAFKSDWQIRMTATCERASDHDNYLGVANDAAMEWDRHERFEPPPIGEFVMLSFSHRDWKRHADVYTTDFHPPSGNGQIWNFTVDTNISGKPVTLRFDHLAAVPNEFEVRLVDVSLQLTQNLRREPKYIYRSTNNGGKKAFRLLIGKSSFIAEHTAEAAAIPTNYELAQNFPNPFSANGTFGNPSTSIKFGLPQKSRATLKIYNLLGKEVATLLDNVEKEAGYHALVWEGKDHHGEAMPSGVYLYRLQTGGTTLIKKMTLIK